MNDKERAILIGGTMHNTVIWSRHLGPKYEMPEYDYEQRKWAVSIYTRVKAGSNMDVENVYLKIGNA
jgi:hypothetical protein